jgi:hypothetical protein
MPDLGAIGLESLPKGSLRLPVLARDSLRDETGRIGHQNRILSLSSVGGAAAGIGAMLVCGFALATSSAHLGSVPIGLSAAAISVSTAGSAVSAEGALAGATISVSTAAAVLAGLGPTAISGTAIGQSFGASTIQATGALSGACDSITLDYGYLVNAGGGGVTPPWNFRRCSPQRQGVSRLDIANIPANLRRATPRNARVRHIAF